MRDGRAGRGVGFAVDDGLHTGDLAAHDLANRLGEIARLPRGVGVSGARAFDVAAAGVDDEARARQIIGRLRRDQLVGRAERRRKVGRLLTLAEHDEVQLERNVGLHRGDARCFDLLDGRAKIIGQAVARQHEGARDARLRIGVTHTADVYVGGLYGRRVEGRAERAGKAAAVYVAALQTLDNRGHLPGGCFVGYVGERHSDLRGFVKDDNGDRHRAVARNDGRITDGAAHAFDLDVVGLAALLDAACSINQKSDVAFRLSVTDGGRRRGAIILRLLRTR